MYQNDAEVLFPFRVTAGLCHSRGEKWQELVARVVNRAEDDPEALAFNLLMIRVNGCLSCHADSFRALRGCTFCARQSLNRFKGSDEDLLQLWEIARDDVLQWLTTGERPTSE